MVLETFRILINEFLDKDPDIVEEETSIIILDSKSSVNIYQNGKYTNHTMHIYRRVYSLRNDDNTKCTVFTGVKEV